MADDGGVADGGWLCWSMVLSTVVGKTVSRRGSRAYSREVLRSSRRCCKLEAAASSPPAELLLAGVEMLQSDAGGGASSGRRSAGGDLSKFTGVMVLPRSRRRKRCCR
jgi:hypothetical protein